jgi:hypothetical protein
VVDVYMRADRIDHCAGTVRHAISTRSPGGGRAEPLCRRAPSLGRRQSARGPRITGAAVTGVRAASFPGAPDECTGATLAAGGCCQVFLRLDTFRAGATDATLRLTEVSGVVHDVPLHGFVIGG